MEKMYITPANKELYFELQQAMEMLKKTEIENAKADGWILGTYDDKPNENVNISNVSMVVLSNEPDPDRYNRLKVILLCVDGSKEYHMKRFIYSVYLTNKNMLTARYKAGEVINVHKINAFKQVERMVLNTNVPMYRTAPELYVERLMVEKPGKKTKK